MKKLLIILPLVLSFVVSGQSRLFPAIKKTSTSSPIDITNAKYMFDGNSYVTGNGHTPASTVFASLSPFVSNGSTFRNWGVGGQTTTDMLTDQSSQVLPEFLPGVVNFLLIEEGGNDIAVSGSVSTAITNMATYCNQARTYATANGITLKIIVSTKIPRNQSIPAQGWSSATFQSKLAEFNTATLADNSYYDYCIRPELEPEFATFVSSGYDPDQIHPSDIGQAKYADLYKQAVLFLTNN